MVFGVLAVLALLAGIAILAYSSDKAVEHSISIASRLGVSPLLIGLVIVSLGTDLPEIFNSILAWGIGHGDISFGDCFGSILAQISLVIGLIALIGETFRVKREEIIVVGACELLALIAAVSMVEKGYILRMNAVFLVASWPLLMLIIKNVMRKDYPKQESDRELHHHIAITIIGYVGVGVGAYIVINSVIALSAMLNIHEYLISFLVDASISPGIGPLFFPSGVSGRLAETTGLYALFASIIVILTLALRQRLDKKAGILFIIIYGFSYVILYVGT